MVPSKWEGVPNVACEAMLSRCPVVATSISDLPIILAQNRGIIIHGTDAENICFGLKKFFNLEQKEVIEITNNAEIFAKNEFDRNKMAYNFSMVLKTVTKNAV